MAVTTVFQITTGGVAVCSHIKGSNSAKYNYITDYILKFVFFRPIFIHGLI